MRSQIRDYSWLSALARFCTFSTLFYTFHLSIEFPKVTLLWGHTFRAKAWDSHVIAIGPLTAAPLQTASCACHGGSQVELAECHEHKTSNTCRKISTVDFFALMASLFLTIVNYQLSLYRIIISSLSSLNLLWPRHLQNILLGPEFLFNANSTTVGLPIGPPDLPTSSAQMHSIETLRGFQLQTSYEGTSYQTKIRKNRWTNITWEVNMWQGDNISYAKHKLQKHCGFHNLNLLIFIFKQCRTSVCARLLCLLWHRHGWRAENRWMFSTQKKHLRNVQWHKLKRWRLSWCIFLTSPSNSATSMGRIVCDHLQFILSPFGPKQLGTRRAANGENINQT